MITIFGKLSAVPAGIRKGRLPLRHSRATVLQRAVPDDDLDALMAEDMKAMGAKPTKSPPIENSAGASVKDTVDKVLIANFFFILCILGWFVIGVGEQTTLQSSKLLDVWYPLWQPVFQPALGVLMVGALASGLVGKKDDQ